MKRNLYLFAFAFSCVLNSCTQDAVIVYSFNEEINKWTIEKLSIFKEMTEASLLGILKTVYWLF